MKWQAVITVPQLVQLDGESVEEVRAIIEEAMQGMSAIKLGDFTYPPKLLHVAGPPEFVVEYVARVVPNLVQPVPDPGKTDGPPPAA